MDMIWRVMGRVARTDTKYEIYSKVKSRSKKARTMSYIGHGGVMLFRPIRPASI
jgi:hypothetical protein